MIRTSTQTARNRRRHAALLAGCALALVLAAMPQAAVAQDANKGFQGNGTVDAGGAIITTFDGGKSTRINVGTPRAVITWKPDDTATSGTIDYLPAGYTAAYSSSSLSDYTVLNRILPGGTATIGINGTITSTVSNGDGQSAGGNVWFYTPNGFVVGPKAVIQVGGLVMTTNDITYSIDPASALPNFIDANGAINFRGPDGSKGSIVNNGFISSGSYVALVAPRIEQHGTVTANRSIAYVAAEQADLKINAGNFDIVIGQGTTDANGIVHDGTSNGSASTGNADQKAMRFVAVPKNTALTMLLSGSIGYTPAASVFNDGSAIVLSAGADGSPDGKISIGATDFRNRLNAHATGDLTVAPPAPGPFSEGTSNTIFESFTSLSGDKSLHLTAVGGTRIQANNGLSLVSDSALGGGAMTLEAFAGGVFTPDGTIAITGTLSADASHSGGTTADGKSGLDSQGGSVTLAADGGQISADSMYLYAGGYGGFGTQTGGDGFGGQIDIRAGLGGGITTSYLDADAQGHGGGSYEFTDTGGVGGLGGVGHGGDITLKDSSGAVADDPTGGHLGFGSVYLYTTAIGGNSLNSGSGLGGDAFGGTVDITLDRQDQTFGFLDSHARAEDGDGASLDPVGGDITLTVGGGIALALDSLHFDTGVYASINSPAGAFGKGGTIDVTVTDGASVSVTNDASLDSLAEISPFFGAATSSPDLTGGTISLTADNGSFQARNIDVDVSAYNSGADVSAGFAKGGAATVTAANGGSIDAVGSESIFDGSLLVQAYAFGTSGGAANVATGGALTLSAQSGGTISARGLFGIEMYASAGSATIDDTSGSGVVAQGGSITVDAIGGTIASELYAESGGFGGDADGNGGDGAAGTIDVRVLDGGELTDYLFAELFANGGSSLVKGDGGDGRGGRFTFESDATAVFTNFSMLFDGGGTGGYAISGAGGDGYGGSAQIDVLGGAHDWGDLFFGARGEGATSQGAGSLAGSGFGSVDGINFHLGAGANMTATDLEIDAGASTGVNGVAGAVAQAGTIDVSVTDGSALTVSGDATLNALAELTSFSGLVSSSPDLTGGTISLLADDGALEANNILVDVSAKNVGADLSAGFAQGGEATLRAANGGSIAAVLASSSEGDNGVLRVEAEGYGTGGASATLATGGAITLASETGATISAESGTIDLNVRGENGTVTGGQAMGVIAQGGEIKIDALGGTIATGIFADASAQGGDADNAAGSGTGGTIDVRVLGGTLVNSLFASASGSGGATTVSGDGGDGLGGRFTLTSDKDATFTEFGMTFYGDGQGGYAIDGTGGDGTGGSAQVDVLGGTHTWFSAYLSGRGFGAPSVCSCSKAGSAFGSVEGLNFHVGGGANLTLGNLDLDASARAGGNGDANEADGGTAHLLVDQLASLSADAIGITGDASMAFEERDPTSYDSTPTAFGGTVSAIADGGTITTPFFSVTANGMTGGALTAAGTAEGGIATIGSSAGGLIDIIGGVEGSGGLVLEARGLGAEGPSAADAIGGIATLDTAGGSISSVFNITVNANAEAGDFAGFFAPSGASNGYSAYGGIATAHMQVGGVGGAITAPSLTVTANGLANQIAPVQGAGGFGSGGIAEIRVEKGLLDTGSILVSASGFGGQAGERSDGGPAFASGAGEGGIAHFQLFGGTIDTTSVTVSANGTGAGGYGATSGAVGSLAGTGQGGIASFEYGGGTLNDSGSLIVQTQGVGGFGAFNPDAGAEGNGADGIGGISSFEASGTDLLDLSSSIYVLSDGVGGLAGSSFDGTRGAGGNGEGGVATMTLADLSFRLGRVEISATGSGGFGATLGTGEGGLAGFRLGDSSFTTAVTPRTIDSLFLGAAGFDATETLSIGGQARFVTAVNSPDAGLTITNGLTLYADGLSGPAGTGALIDISGAPVTVGGALEVTTPRGALFTIADGGALGVTGNLDVLVGRSLSSTGAISTAANARVIANNGISMADLSVGGTTLLQAINGPVVVSHDLQSIGPVTVLGKSVSIVSLGALSFADADATAGDLSIETAGDLLLATADATGAVTLTSNGGSIHNTGAVNGVGIFYTAAGNVQSDAVLASAGALGVDAGGTFTAPGTVSAAGNVSLSADLGMALAGVVSGGTTLLQASDGSLSVDSLTSPGLVTAEAQSVTIGSPGALRFARAQATAGNLSLITTGNLALAQGGASGAVTLTSGGRITGSGPIVSGGDTAVAGSADVALGTVASGGTTSLSAANGTVNVTDLNSAGEVTASGRAVTIGSTGALSFADLDATTGNVTIQTAGNLAVDTVDAVGSISLVSTGGALNADGTLNGAGIALRSSGNLQTTGSLSSIGAATLESTGGTLSVTAPINADSIALNSLGDLQVTGALGASGAIGLTSATGAIFATDSLTAGGPLNVSGNSGITFLGAAISGAATDLTSANGFISLRDLTSTGQVSASGRSIDITSSGELTFTLARATAGDLSLRTAGSLFLERASATGAIDLTSTGASVGWTGTGAVVAGGDVSIDAADAIAFGPVTSGGSTSLVAGGSLFAGNLLSAGAVTAIGGTVAIDSTGALAFANVEARAGNISIRTAGDLALQQADASGAIFLSSTGGTIGANGPVIADARVVADGFAGLTFGTLTSGSDTVLTSSNGAMIVTNLNSALGIVASGRSIDIGSSGTLIFDGLDATAGNIGVQTAGDLLVRNVSAPGSVTLASSGGSLDTASIDADGITLSSLDTLDITGDLTSAGAISLTSTGGTVQSIGLIAANGNLTVNADDNVLLSGSATSGGTTDIKTFDGAIVVHDLLSAGPVTVSGRSITIGSTGALEFADARATGGDLDLTAAGDLNLAQGSASGAVNLISTGGSVSGPGPIVAGGNVAVSGGTGITLGTLTSGGATVLSSVNGAVGVTDLNSAGVVTANGTAVGIGSSGALSFADVDATAGNVAVQTAGNLSVDTVNATGSITLVSSGGALSAGGVLTGNGIALTSLANLSLAGGVSTPGAINLTSTGGSVNSNGLVDAGGALSVSGKRGISLGSASSGATTSLTAANGAINVSDLNSTGAVTATGRSIDIASTGALTFANARATAGALKLAAAGNLAVTLGSATGPMSLTSSAGTVTSTGTLAAGGNASVSGGQGVTLASLTSGGTTALASANGGVIVNGLTSAGNVSATGRSVSIVSPGALTFANAQATAGNLNVTTAGALSVAQAGATGRVTLASTNGSISGGPITSGGNAILTGETGIALATLNSGGTTTLTSANGAVGVTNLNSAGAVTARARSITIGSTGALTFADLDATAGDIAVQTAGNLALGAADATGAIGLTSTNGAVTASGPVAAGGNLSVSGNTGVSLGPASSGGSTNLGAANGAIAVTELASANAVTAVGRSVGIGSSRALTFANAQATGGDLTLTTAGDLVIAQGSAAGALALTSTDGMVASSGTLSSGGNASVAGNLSVDLARLASGGTTTLTSANGSVNVTDNLASTGSLTALAGGGDLTINSNGDLAVAQAAASGALRLTSLGGAISGAGLITAGGSATIVGSNGIALGSLTTGGTVHLASQNGALSVTDLNTAGVVTLARGRSVTIGSSGGLTFGDIDATTGDIAVQTIGNLTLDTADATGAVALTSSGGAVSANGAVIAGGNLAVSGDSGIALGDATSGGATSLASVNGAVSVTHLHSAGVVTASGRSVTIGSTGALTFADLDASAGDIAVQTAGNLAVSTVDATGSITLTSTDGALQADGSINGNGIALSSRASLQLTGGLATVGAISLASTNGTVTADSPVSAGGKLAVSGKTGIALDAATSGGATSLTSANGAVAVNSLNSAGNVTASGRSVSIASPGALTFANAQATAGNLNLTTAGHLSIALANAAGALTLTSDNGSVSATGPITSGGNAIVTGDAGIALGALTSGGTTSLASANGAVGVTDLNSAGVGSSRVDLQACKLEYSIVSPK